MSFGEVGDAGLFAGGGAEKLVPIRRLFDAHMQAQALRQNARRLPRFAPRPGFLTGAEFNAGVVGAWAWRHLFVDVPASSAGPGEPGQRAYDGTYVYEYLPGVGWRRIAHSSF
jgi:hypothetical protein